MSIPINHAKPIIEQALKADVSTQDGTQSGASEDAQAPAQNNGLVGKPRMGVTITSLSGAAVQSGALPRGVYVLSVDSGSPAEAAGVQPFDIIVDVNDQVITSTSELMDIIGSMKEGDQVQLKVFRTGVDLSTATTLPTDGEYVDLTLTLAIVDAVNQ